MNVKVLYHSTTGNTKKIANAIASELGVKAEPIASASVTGQIDLLFLGDGVYFGKPNKETAAFIELLNAETAKNVAVFATYGGQAAIGETLKKQLQAKNLHVVGKPFTCKGKAWGLMNRNHPNETDLRESRRFAKAIVSSITV